MFLHASASRADRREPQSAQPGGQALSGYQAVHRPVRCALHLLTATPYNKTYLDLSAQLRLFVDDDKDIGVRPERLLRDMGEAEFTSRFQVLPNTLAAFEKSAHADDWRELMRLFWCAARAPSSRPTTRRPTRTAAILLLGRTVALPTSRSACPRRLRSRWTAAMPATSTRLYSSPWLTPSTASRSPLRARQLPGRQRSRAGGRGEQRGPGETCRGSGKRLLGYCRTGLFMAESAGAPSSSR